MHERVTMFLSFWMCATVLERGKSIRSWEFTRCGICLVTPNRTWVRITRAVTVSVVQHVAERRTPESSRSMSDLMKCRSSVAVCEIFPKSTSSPSLTALTRPRSRLDSLRVPRHLDTVLCTQPTSVQPGPQIFGSPCLHQCTSLTTAMASNGWPPDLKRVISSLSTRALEIRLTDEACVLIGLERSSTRRSPSAQTRTVKP